MTWGVLQVNVKAKSAFNNKLFALNVVISIPVPDNTAKADIQTTQGMCNVCLACRHAPSSCHGEISPVEFCFNVVWPIDQLPSWLRKLGQARVCHCDARYDACI